MSKLQIDGLTIRDVINYKRDLEEMFDYKCAVTLAFVSSGADTFKYVSHLLDDTTDDNLKEFLNDITSLPRLLALTDTLLQYLFSETLLLSIPGYFKDIHLEESDLKSPLSSIGYTNFLISYFRDIIVVMDQIDSSNPLASTLLDIKKSMSIKTHQATDRSDDTSLMRLSEIIEQSSNPMLKWYTSSLVGIELINSISKVKKALAGMPTRVTH